MVKKNGKSPHPDGHLSPDGERVCFKSKASVPDIFARFTPLTMTNLEYYFYLYLKMSYQELLDLREMLLYHYLIEIEKQETANFWRDSKLRKIKELSVLVDKTLNPPDIGERELRAYQEYVAEVKRLDLLTLPEN